VPLSLSLLVPQQDKNLSKDRHFRASNVRVGPQAQPATATAGLGRGLRGVIVLRVAKDRPGSVRESCGDYRKLDRTQEAARVIIDSRDPQSSAVTIQAPRVGGEGPRTFRPTGLMEKASMLIEEQPGLSKNILVTQMGSKKSSSLQAIDMLKREGYISQTIGSNNSQLHTSLRQYRQAADPQSDTYGE